jgi:hypothetical protein
MREALKNAVAKLQEVTTRADNIATCRDRWMKIAADCGRMDGEDVGEFMARLAQQAALGVELAGCYEDLRVRNVKQEQELEELRAFAKADNKRHGDLRDEMTAACRIAGSFGMRGDESLAQFADRICGNKVSALEGKIERLNAKLGPLEKL